MAVLILNAIFKNLYLASTPCHYVNFWNTWLFFNLLSAAKNNLTEVLILLWLHEQSDGFMKNALFIQQTPKSTRLSNLLGYNFNNYFVFDWLTLCQLYG